MKLAYLLNSYPLISTTFIRREIAALEAIGAPVTRFAVRRWDGTLVDPDDLAEQGRTEYLLSGNVPRLLGSAMLEALSRLPRLLSVLPLWWQVYRRAGSGLVRHVAYLVQALAFRRRAAALGVDHVHAHFSTNAACVAMLARALGGPRYSFTVHGPDELVDPHALALDRKVAGAAFVVAITDYCRGRIAAEAPAHSDRIVVVPCGIDLADFPMRPADPARAHRLVCVGRLCANKAQILIPQAVAAVRERFPDVVVDLVGDGDERPLIEAEIARHGVEGAVRILGWAANEEVVREVGDAAFLLLPSLAEGLPIVLMEALALGRPVLTTRIAGIPELVDAGCGWIFEPGLAEAIATAMGEALATPPEARAALGAEGRRRIEHRHDVRRSAAALLAAFRTASG